MTGFSLSSLIPEPLTFNDDAAGGDGAQYDVKTAPMLGAVDAAKMDRLQKRLSLLLSEPDADAEATAAQLENVLNEFVGMLVIGMAPARVTQIPFGFKLAFVEWWQREATNRPLTSKATMAPA